MRTVFAKRLPEGLIIACILLIVFFVRWQNINSTPYGIEQDEYQWSVTSFLNMYDISSADKGVWSFNEETSHIFPVTFFFDKASFLLFGPNITSPRKLLEIVSICSLFFFYLFIRKFFSIITSGLVLLVYAFSTYKMITSRIVEGSAYCDLFVFASSLLVISIPFDQTVISYIAFFGAGICASLAALTYNQGYLVPLVILSILLYRLFLNKKKIAICALYILIFLVPICVYLPHLWYSIQAEMQAKNYALVSSSLSAGFINFKQIYVNAITIWNMLFANMQTDMIVAYPGSLVNRVIILSAILGLGISFFRVKKYYPMLFFFIFLTIPYQLILGINLPRWWYISVSIIYIFAGITIDMFLKLSKRYIKQYNFIIIFFLIIATGYIIKVDLNKYYVYALYNPDFASSAHRDMFEITHQYRQSLGKSIAFIFPDNDWYNRDLVTNTAASFNFLVAHPTEGNLLRVKSRSFFHIMTISEFLAAKNYQQIHEFVVPKGLAGIIHSDLQVEGYSVVNNNSYSSFCILYLR